MRYYIIAASAGHETLRLRKITHAGSNVGFVIKCNSTSRAQCATSAQPSSTHSTHVIDSMTTQLDIERQDDTNCFYILAIQLSSASFTAYQVSATKQNNLLLLQSGISVTDHVDGGGGYDYFYFVPNLMADTTVRLTITFGDADLFISTTRVRPGPGNRSDYF